MQKASLDSLLSLSGRRWHVCMLWECDLSSVSRFQFAWRWRWSIAGRFPEQERERTFSSARRTLTSFFFIYISSCLYAAEAGGRVDGADTYYLLLDVPITLSSSLWGGDQTLKGSQSSLEQKNTTPASLKITLSAQLPVAWWPPSIWELIQSSGKKIWQRTRPKRCHSDNYPVNSFRGWQKRRSLCENKFTKPTFLGWSCARIKTDLILQ